MSLARLESMSSLQKTAAFVTDFADQAVLLPGAALIALLLLLVGWRRGAVAWSLVITGTFALMLVLKLGFSACGHLVGNGEIESPSGHTAAAGVFYGSILAFVTERAFGRTALTVAAVVFVAALVGMSRLVLGAHTVAEVCVGAGVGICAALLMLRSAGAPPERDGRMVAFMLPAFVLLFLFHGIHLPAEAAIRSAAREIWPSSACR